MDYLFIFMVLITVAFLWNTLSMRRKFSCYSKTYGIGVGKIIRLYRQAAYEARKDGIKLTPEAYAANNLSQIMNRLTGDDISGLRQ